jgi:hypothetical protein
MNIALRKKIASAVSQSSVRKLLEDGYFQESKAIPYPNHGNFKGKPCQCCGLISDSDADIGKKAYYEALKKFRAETALRVEMFKVACFYELGIKDTRAAHKAWDLAWENGHSNGYYEVYGHLEDLSEILKLM